jgi:outer membrane protein assembly factor BamA
MLGTGPVIRYDSRNNVNYPGKGAYIETSALWFRKNNVFEYKFRFYNIDIRKYVTLFNDVIIAFQANASVSKGNIPFYRMPTIGGKFSLRGISNKFMYIDQNCWYTQAEIRKHITWRIGGVAFAGVGNNFKTWDADMYQNVKATYGLGARFQMIPRDKLNLRFDYAFGPHGDSGFYATVREVF